MQLSDYIHSVETEGARFAAAAEHGPLDAAIEACPDWDVRELVRHLGMIHLWAATNVAFPSDDWPDVHDLPDLIPFWPELATTYPANDCPVDWYRSTLDNLVDVLKAAPVDHECFSFLPAPTPVTMWARRQASEIAIHRFDAEHARGTQSKFGADFATDMLDELLSGFAVRPGQIKDLAQPKRLHVHADDTDEHWWLSVGPELTQTSRCNQSGKPADLSLRASAADLYVLLWNRTPATEVARDGDHHVLDLWQNNFRVRWS